MKKALKTLLNIFAAWLIAACIAGALYLAYLCGADTSLRNQNPTSAPIPTFTGIQTMLVNAGYDIGDKGIDGWIGKNTLKAWDSAICNQYSEQYFSDGKGK